MSFLYVGAAATVIGTVGSAVSSATRDNEVKNTTKVEFPEETRRLFQFTEEPLLRGAMGEQMNLLAPLMGGFRTQDQARQQFQTQKARALVLSAGKRGAQQSGVTDLGPLTEGLQGLDPQLLAALQQLALQRGAGTRTVTPPGYGQFLSPSTTTAQEGGGPSSFETGFQIAAGLAGAAGGFYRG